MKRSLFRKITIREEDLRVSTIVIHRGVEAVPQPFAREAFLSEISSGLV
jgi:hypothetical protein